MNNTWLKGSTDTLSVQLFRYTLVGGVAFLVDIGSLGAAVEVLHINYLVSATMAFLFGLLTNYALSILWVFNHRKSQSRLNEFLIFSIIGAAGLGLNELFIWIFTELLLFHYLVSKLFSTVFVYLWNFFARKYALFS
jgi:putative flippase GtrA